MPFSILDWLIRLPRSRHYYILCWYTLNCFKKQSGDGIQRAMRTDTFKRKEYILCSKTTGAYKRFGIRQIRIIVPVLADLVVLRMIEQPNISVGIIPFHCISLFSIFYVLLVVHSSVTEMFYRHSTRQIHKSRVLEAMYFSAINRPSVCILRSYSLLQLDATHHHII